AVALPSGAAFLPVSPTIAAYVRPAIVVAIAPLLTGGRVPTNGIRLAFDTVLPPLTPLLNAASIGGITAHSLALLLPVCAVS
ncbi:hypothetical protein WAJ69_21855, partial [Acinetobacter baumannii]